MAAMETAAIETMAAVMVMMTAAMMTRWR